MSQNNGRINLSQPPASEKLFELYDKNVNHSKATPYTDAVQGIFYNTALSDIFFSGENIQIIQNGLRVGVYEKSKNKFIIGEQDMDTVKVIMRSIFLQHATHSNTDIKGQIEALNQIVLDEMIPKVYGEAIGYMNYRRDASTIAVPMTPPVMSRTNERQLEEKPWIYDTLRKI